MKRLSQKARLRLAAGGLCLLVMAIGSNGCGGTNCDEYAASKAKEVPKRIKADQQTGMFWIDSSTGYPDQVKIREWNQEWTPRLTAVTKRYFLAECAAKNGSGDQSAADSAARELAAANLAVFVEQAKPEPISSGPDIPMFLRQVGSATEWYDDYFDGLPTRVRVDGAEAFVEWAQQIESNSNDKNAETIAVEGYAQAAAKMLAKREPAYKPSTGGTVD